MLFFVINREIKVPKLQWCETCFIDLHLLKTPTVHYLFHNAEGNTKDSISFALRESNYFISLKLSIEWKLNAKGNTNDSIDQMEAPLLLIGSAIRDMFPFDQWVLSLALRESDCFISLLLKQWHPFKTPPSSSLLAQYWEKYSGLHWPNGSSSSFIWFVTRKMLPFDQWVLSLALRKELMLWSL